MGGYSNAGHGKPSGAGGWLISEEETLGFTHPFFRDGRARGAAIVCDEIAIATIARPLSPRLTLPPPTRLPVAARRPSPVYTSGPSTFPRKTVDFTRFHHRSRLGLRFRPSPNSLALAGPQLHPSPHHHPCGFC